MNNLIDQLIKKSDITIKNPEDFKALIKEFQAQNIYFGVANRNSRVDEADYILKRFIGEDHNFIIVAGGGKELFDKEPHINKVIEVINSNNSSKSPIKITEVVLIDDNPEVIKGTIRVIDNSKDHCSAIQIEPGDVNSGLELLLNFINTSENHIDANSSQFYSKLPVLSELTGQDSSLNI